MRISVRAASALLAAAVMITLAAPGAGAAFFDHGTPCILRHGAVGRSTGHITRDVVRLAGTDRLTRWLARHPNAETAARAQLAARRAITIPVAFHVLREDLTAAGGNVPLSQIRAQIAVLNASYGGTTGGATTGFQFSLASVDRTTNKRLFNMSGNGKDRQMKQALKVGGLETLNIYSVDLGKRLLGYAYLAQDAAAVGALDGVVIHYNSLPGGPWGPDYSGGDTATHEVGHWMALLHTFDGGCNRGDLIDDTPAEASPAFECPIGRDTCTAPGLDPITNFMDYTFDSCMYAFTPDQGLRMQEAWRAYRAP